MILVAGGTGTLGRRLVRRLVERGRPVRILARSGNAVGADIHDAVDLALGDVRDRLDVDRAMQGVDLVVSAVHGFVGPRDVSPASVDRDGNGNLVDAASAAGASFVLMSIMGAAPDHPMDLMRMKFAAEEHLRASGIPSTVVRATAFFETWIALFEQTASRSGRPLVFGRGDNPIDFVSADDVAALLERAVIDPATRGRVLEIGGPEDISMNRLAAAVQEAHGRSGSPRHIPRPMLRAMGTVMRPFAPALARQARAAVVMDTADMTFDATSAREAFPELPTATVDEVLSRPSAPRLATDARSNEA
jgi:uncharacterized protein YbjT (DUF2867 family)